MTNGSADALLPPDSLVNSLHFIVTGGTIDGIDLDRGTSAENSKILPYLNQAIKVYFPFSSEVAFLKDSRSITIEDRMQLLRLVLATACRRIIITHGTFTMAETGRFLKRELAKRGADKVVVLVGAMVPMGEADSDAPYNLGFAVASSMTLPPGVWVAMQSTAWDPDEVEKDLELHRFKKRFAERAG